MRFFVLSLLAAATSALHLSLLVEVKPGTQGKLVDSDLVTLATIAPSLIPQDASAPFLKQLTFSCTVKDATTAGNQLVDCKIRGVPEDQIEAQRVNLNEKIPPLLKSPTGVAAQLPALIKGATVVTDGRIEVVIEGTVSPTVAPTLTGVTYAPTAPTAAPTAPTSASPTATPTAPTAAPTTPTAAPVAANPAPLASPVSASVSLLSLATLTLAL